MDRPIVVHHIITRMILGGAQENTLLTVLGLQKRAGFRVKLITGPALGPEGSLLDRAQAEKVDLVVMPQMRRAINPLRDYSTMRELVKILRRDKPDVVHTHSSKAGVLGREAARKARVPHIVHTVHGLPFHQYEKNILNRIYVALERRCARYTDRIISVADAMTEESVKMGIAPRDRYVTIHSGMEVEPYLKDDYDVPGIRSRLGLSGADFVICKIARLFHLKGQEYLIRAMPGILKAVPNAKLLLVGDGILREFFADMATGLGVGDKVFFAGLLPPEDIPGMIHASDIVVHTSLREGLPRVMPQALISGKAVVCYDVGGAREVVIDGETGFLLPPESVDGLVESVVRLACDSELRRRMGSEGRRRFADVFRAERMVDRIAGLYEELLGTK